MALVDDAPIVVDGDANAVHVNEASEISAIALKAAPTGADIVIIEDAADGNNKKRVAISSLPTVAVNPQGQLKVAKANGDHLTIAAALAAAVAGTVVTVFPGTYIEANPLTIPTGVSLNSAGGRESVIIEANDATKHVIIMNAAKTVINGFTLKGASNAGVAGIHMTSTCVTSEVRNIEFDTCNIGILVDATSKDNFGDGILWLSGSGARMAKVTAGAHIVLHGLVTSAALTLDEVVLCDGAASIAHIFSSHLDGDLIDDCMKVTNGGFIRVTGSHIHSFDHALHIATGGGQITALSTDILSSRSLDLLSDNGVGDFFNIGASEIRRNLQSLAPGTTVQGTTINTLPGDEGTDVLGEFSVGRPEKGAESSFGEGDSHVLGLTVLTTDNTASPTVDGGTLTDVSVAAASASVSTFTFQGTGVNNSLLICTDRLDDNSVKLKHWGWKVSQTIAMSANGAVIFEIWDGAAWAETNVMSIHSNLNYRYGNTVFIRTNTSEQFRFGVDPNTTWVAKAINGTTGFWVRVRITSAPTVLPVFEQIKLSTNRSELEADGFLHAYGLAMWQETLIATGNVFSGTGTTDGNISIGNGGGATGWVHKMNQSQLNSNGDFVAFNISLPRGICTCQPITVRVVSQWDPASGVASGDESVILSVLPIEVQGNEVADPAGGLVPVSRTEANTELVTSKAAYTETYTPAVTATSKIQRFQSGPFDISDYYEGDVLAIRIELDDDGTNNSDLIVWSIEISGLKFAMGDHQ